MASKRIRKKGLYSYPVSPYSPFFIANTKSEDGTKNTYTVCLKNENRPLTAGLKTKQEAEKVLKIIETFLKSEEEVLEISS